MCTQVMSCAAGLSVSGAITSDGQVQHPDPSAYYTIWAVGPLYSFVFLSVLLPPSRFCRAEALFVSLPLRSW